MKKLVLLILCVGLTNAGAAGPPASLQLSQARLTMPTLSAYLAVSDGEGKPINELRAEQFSANLGELKLPVEQVQPFEKSGEGIAYIMLVDVSKSLKPEQFDKIRTALSEWVDALSANDRMALLSFGDSVKTVLDFSTDKALLKQKIRALNPTDMQTALHKALIQAIHTGQRADANLPKRRVIVVLSDGIDELPVGPTKEEVLEQMKSDRIPLYAMGLDKQKHDAKHDAGITALGLFARSSGGDYMDVGKLPFEKVYANTRERIKAVTVLRLDCKACPGDATIHRLQITLQDGGLALNDGVDMRMLASPPPSPPEQTKPDQVTPQKPDWQQPWVYISSGVAALLIIAGILWRWRRKRPNANAVETIVNNAESTQNPEQNASVLLVGHFQAAPNLPKCLVQLVEVGNKERSKTYKAEVGAEAIIGRGSQCAVSIPSDSEISSRHCCLRYKNQAIFLQDLGSTNGTQVNGVPISSQYRLQEGDIIGIGRTELRVLILGKKS